MIYLRDWLKAKPAAPDDNSPYPGEGSSSVIPRTVGNKYVAVRRPLNNPVGLEIDSPDVAIGTNSQAARLLAQEFRPCL